MCRHIYMQTHVAISANGPAFKKAVANRFLSLCKQSGWPVGGLANCLRHSINLEIQSHHVSGDKFAWCPPALYIQRMWKLVIITWFNSTGWPVSPLQDCLIHSTNSQHPDYQLVQQYWLASWPVADLHNTFNKCATCWLLNCSTVLVGHIARRRIAEGIEHIWSTPLCTFVGCIRLSCSGLTRKPILFNNLINTTLHICGMS